ncbi:MAG: hypothetical protein IKF72_09590 [Kiritimatiellae bacterium]|nr:hypothetical protein [Kiritimatiellia bacterium]
MKSAAAGAAVAALGGCASRVPSAAARVAQPRFMWAYLAHFGMKMWESRSHYADLKVDDSMWLDLTERAAKIGVNAFVIDLGEGMVFPSHPELAVRGSWEPDRMKAEIARLKKMGMVAVPKLNFSSSHDQWLGKWRPYLSTPEYFQVCSEIIRDVAEVFDETPLFHLGYDEETYFIQNVNKFEYKRLRSGNLWWHDFLWFVAEVEKYGMRPWIWSDMCWEHKDEFLSRMPRTVLQSNWYYEKEFAVSAMKKENRKAMVETYATLEKARYDQVPCGSTYSCRENFGRTVAHCRKVIDAVRLKGFFMAPWYYCTQEEERGKIMESLDVMAAEIARQRETAPLSIAYASGKI